MKYQNVNPLAKLRDGEIYFFLRAQDKLAPEAVTAYADLLKRESERAFADGDTPLSDRLLKQALEVIRLSSKMLDWQGDNAQFVKIPD